MMLNPKAVESPWAQKSWYLGSWDESLIRDIKYSGYRAFSNFHHNSCCPERLQSCSPSSVPHTGLSTPIPKALHHHSTEPYLKPQFTLLGYFDVIQSPRQLFPLPASSLKMPHWGGALYCPPYSHRRKKGTENPRYPILYLTQVINHQARYQTQRYSEFSHREKLQEFHGFISSKPMSQIISLFQMV